jgi:hypothetical protein
LKNTFITISLIIIFVACTKKITSSTAQILFENTPVSNKVETGKVDEASGMADSKLNMGFLWVEEDSGNPPAISLLSPTGIYKKSIFIKGAKNRDWEDMMLGPGPQENVNYVYLADIGDNREVHTNYFIYRFPEPSMATDSVFAWGKITFKYPDGSHDAEAIIMDNISKDIYIVTKRGAKSRIYKLPFPQNTTGVMTATFIADLAFTGATSAATSVDGSEIIIKTYTGLYYWKRKAGETIEAALSKSSISLGYVVEQQGESICFKNDDSGFYTLSERPFTSPVSLSFYKRK